MTSLPNNDEQHLKLLSIFHYVDAALVALLSSIFLIHAVLGIVMLVSPESLAGSAKGAPPAWFGLIFAIIGCGAVLTGWSFAVCVWIAGRYLARRKHYVFCLVVAALNCAVFPFGTVLGVFTIVVLMRDSVKMLFNPVGQVPVVTP